MVLISFIYLFILLIFVSKSKDENWPNIDKYFDKKYSNLPKDVTDLIKALIHYNPKKRISIDSALECEYFKKPRSNNIK